MPSWALILIRRYGLTLLLLAALAFGGWYLRGVFADRAALRVEVKAEQAARRAAESALARAAEAAEIHRAHIARMEEDAAAWRGLLDDFQQMEGADAPLSPFLRAASGRVLGR